MSTSARVAADGRRNHRSSRLRFPIVVSSARHTVGNAPPLSPVHSNDSDDASDNGANPRTNTYVRWAFVIVLFTSLLVALTTFLPWNTLRAFGSSSTADTGSLSGAVGSGLFHLHTGSSSSRRSPAIAAAASNIGTATATPTAAPTATPTVTANPSYSSPAPVWPQSDLLTLGSNGGMKVIAVYPHDGAAFTQGLLYNPENKYFFESTGLYGKSSIRKVDPSTGQVVKKRLLEDPRLFGEGLTLFQDVLIMITWKKKVGIVFDPDTFDVLRRFTYETKTGEGWGLTHNGTHLVVSDGSSSIFFWDIIGSVKGDSSTPFVKEVRRIQVRDPYANNAFVSRLNELEYVRGEILANVWFDDRIARIHPITGMVKGWIDFRGTSRHSRYGSTTGNTINGVTVVPLHTRSGREETLNGIAYDSTTDRLFLTGKLWKKLYVLKVIGGDD